MIAGFAILGMNTAHRSECRVLGCQFENLSPEMLKHIGKARMAIGRYGWSTLDKTTSESRVRHLPPCYFRDAPTASVFTIGLTCAVEKLHPARMNHDWTEVTIIEVCCLLDEQPRLLNNQTKITDMSVERCGNT